MSATVYTARYSYSGPDRLDVTLRGAREARKRGQVSPGEPFAPPAWLLNYAKGYSQHLPRGVEPPTGDALFDWYGLHYRAAMQHSYRAHRAAWDALLARDLVTLVCFCANSDACHRGLLAGYLAACGATIGGER